MPEPPISFARGAPAPEFIPAAELADCAHAVALREGASLFSYGPGGGYGPLREWVAERHGVEPGRVVLTVGGLLGFVLYAAELLERRPGRVLVEAPTYDRPLKILAREGAEVVALPMDDEGLDPDGLERELRRRAAPPSFLYTIPTFQNPSGRTLSTERRRRIVELVAAHELPVLEDDPYGLVRYEGEPEPTLHELEGGRLVTYTSSFSKTVAPGLRTGYFVLPAGEAGGFEERAVSTYISPPFLAQATIAEFVARGRFEPNLAHVRAELRARRDAMLAALERVFPPGVSWSRPQGGYFLWLDLGSGDASALAARAVEERVAIVEGAGFFPAGSRAGAAAARLAFSFESPSRIEEGVARLAALLPR
ncbi:MAG: PLP-dependent aminotransferase family protein [Thermoleophilia bacterium]|nr:PLP-dependent aminotransferase family protein [Gaiellaceae bacterium]MDW8339733.1 PLP-dependent aminotransferase family protein [Thermoleophilia bacterium]